MYSIWAEPAEKDAKYLLEIIDCLGKKYGAPSFCPHITVYGQILTRALAERSVKSCANLEKFTVTTAGLAFSDDLWKTVFVNVHEDQNLRKTHDAIGAVAPDTKYEFHPHISLIYKKLPVSEKKAIIGSLDIKQKLAFDKISAIESSDAVEEWQVVDRVALR